MYVSQYFPPEMGAPAARVAEFSRAWSELGAHVTVLTGFPNHPTGVLPPRYRRTLLARECHGGVYVVRTWLYATANAGVVKRSLGFLSFMFSAITSGALFVRQVDAVIGTSPQFFAAVAAWALAKLRRVPFIFEVRDLWPDSIIAVGIRIPSPVLKVLRSVEMMLYRDARLVVVVTDSTRSVLCERGVAPGKVVVVKNGVDLETFRAGTDRELTRRRLGLEGRFVVTYIGTIGMAHALGIVPRAAALALAQGFERLTFLVVGEGARKAALVEEVRRAGAGDVRVLDAVPREHVPAVLAASDACLVHLKDDELFRTVIPSKIFEVMAAGRPLLLGVRGETERLVAQAGAGLAFAPEDADDLVEKMDILYGDPKLCQKLGRSGRAFVEANFSRRKLAREYGDHLLRAVATAFDGER